MWAEFLEDKYGSIEVGKVVGTKPVAGAKRKNGTEVTLYISTGDANIKIDNYIGQN